MIISMKTKTPNFFLELPFFPSVIQFRGKWNARILESKS